MQRPATVTVFGILNIGFAVLGLFGMIVTIAVLSASAGSNNPMVNIIRENPAFAAWMKINVPLGILSCVLLLAAGIGLLMLKEWARKLSIGYAIYAIVSGLVGTVLTFVFVTRPMLERASQAQGPEAAGAIGGVIGGSIGGCVGLIYPVILLIFMLRPKVAAAFRPAGTPPAMPSM
jgi:hypothetical protein